MILRKRRAEMSLQVKGQEELWRGFRETQHPYGITNAAAPMASSSISI